VEAPAERDVEAVGEGDEDMRLGVDHRRSRAAGGACTHWKAPPYHGAHPTQTFASAGWISFEPQQTWLNVGRSFS
jgi:hypothetical protein